LEGLATQPIEEEEEEEGWGAFDPDAGMRPEEEEEDMHVFQPEEELDVNVERRESVASRVELVRGAGDSVASDRQLQVSCMLGRRFIFFEVMRLIIQVLCNIISSLGSRDA
jgi:hypothetical protein